MNTERQDELLASLARIADALEAIASLLVNEGVLIRK